MGVKTLHAINQFACKKKIAGYRPAQEFGSSEHDTNQSHDWATFMNTLIRLIQINQHNYQQSW